MRVWNDPLLPPSVSRDRSRSCALFTVAPFGMVTFWNLSQNETSSSCRNRPGSSLKNPPSSETSPSSGPVAMGRSRSTSVANGRPRLLGGHWQRHRHLGDVDLLAFVDVGGVQD